MKTAERMTDAVVVWEVLQAGTVICSYKMGLTKREAENKIANERRLRRGGDLWSIRPVPVQMERG